LLLRLIFICFVVYVLYAALRSYLNGGKSNSGRRRKPPSDGEDMVLDPQCQCYVPKRDAVLEAGQYFCSPQCARLYLSR
jgi:hypothetical protein